MFFLRETGRIKLMLGVILVIFASGGFAQSLESVAFSLTLPDGQTGGIKQRSTITNLVQRPEGIYVLTERDGCYLLSSQSNRQHALLAQPTDRREHFNYLFRKGKEVQLVVNFHQLRSLSTVDEEPLRFTSRYFANTVQPTAIHQTTNGKIVVGTALDGIFVFEQDEFGGYTHVPERISTADWALPSNIVHTIFEDRQGVIWVGTDRGLATLAQDTTYNLGKGPHFEPNWWQRFWGIEGPPPLYNGPVKAITEWGDSIVFASEEQLYKIPSNPKELSELHSYNLEKHMDEALSEVKQILIDHRGEVWIAARQLLNYNILTDELHVIGSGQGLRGLGVCTLMEDTSGGYIWVGTQRGGLYRFNTERYSKITD
ncbi:MAG: two-component regulator propeller domain-containing protein [Bacteroidota bacterium]